MDVQLPASVKTLDDVKALATIVSIMLDEGKTMEQINSFFVNNLNCIDLKVLETNQVSD